MLSKLSFIIPNAASIILDQEKGRNKVGKHKKPDLRNMVICGGIFTLQITDMADSHGIKITDDLRNYYKLLEVPRLY